MILSVSLTSSFVIRLTRRIDILRRLSSTLEDLFFFEVRLFGWSYRSEDRRESAPKGGGEGLCLTESASDGALAVAGSAVAVEGTRLDVGASDGASEKNIATGPCNLAKVARFARRDAAYTSLLVSSIIGYEAYSSDVSAPGSAS